MPSVTHEWTVPNYFTPRPGSVISPLWVVGLLPEATAVTYFF
jgi:hypothetical protein